MNRLARVLFNYFIKGLLFVVPMGVACFLIWWLVATIDKSLNLSDILWINPKTGKPIYIPGLGILTVLVVIMIGGIFVTNVVTDPIKSWFYRWLNRLPLFKFLYFSIKDLTEAFVGEEKKFNEPVLVEVNEFGLKKIGFLTPKGFERHWAGRPGSRLLSILLFVCRAGGYCSCRKSEDNKYICS